MKCSIFKNLSTATNKKSHPILVWGNPNTKSMDRSNQKFFKIGNNMYKPILCTCPSPYYQIWHLWTISYTSLFNYGQQYRSSTSDLSYLDQYEHLTLLHAIIICFFKELRGIHNWLALNDTHIKWENPLHSDGWNSDPNFVQSLHPLHINLSGIQNQQLH